MHSPTIIDLLRTRASETPQGIAYTYLSENGAQETNLTYAELDWKARTLAARLQDLRLNEPVVLLYAAGLEFISSFFGCLYAGVIAAPSPLPHRRHGAGRLHSLLADSGAMMVLTSRDAASGLRADTLGSEVRLLMTDDPDHSGPAEDWHPPDFSGNEIAYLQYTSGSTAAPKGVIISHANLIHNLRYIDSSFNHSPDSISVSWLPHFHDMGIVYGLLAPIYSGFRAILMSPASFLQRPLRWLESISRYRATHSGAPNFAYDLCARGTTPADRERLNLASWQVAFSGAEFVREETLNRFADSFAATGFRSSAFYPAYGLAEATLKVCCKRPGRWWSAQPLKEVEGRVSHPVRGSMSRTGARRVVGCGQPGDGMEVMIVEPRTHRRCGPDEIGEIWVSGPSVARGYWRRPAESEETFRARLAEADERDYLRTGDLGFISEGELFITGRLKNLIIIRGENHYSEDLEQTVQQCHPAFRPGGTAVFSVDLGGIEGIVVLQELERQYKGSMEPLVQAVRAGVAEDHQVQVYAVVCVRQGTLPKTTSGKIQRHLCRERFLGGSLTVIHADLIELSETDAETGAGLTPSAGSSGEPGLEALMQILSRLLRITTSRLAADRPLTACGIDSLSAAQLAGIIESQWQVSITASELLDGMTAQQLASRIIDGRSGAELPTPIEVRSAGASPLSFEQERFWLIHHSAPDSAVYHLSVALRFEGCLDPVLLERSLGEVVRRHESLRTSIRTLDGELRQLVDPALKFDLPKADLRSESVTPSRLEAELAGEQKRQFDLGVGPMIRAKLFHLADQEYLLLLVMHHIISDAQSMGVLISELVQLYQAFSSGRPSPLPELPIQYGDFAFWQRERAKEKKHPPELDYWREQLAGSPPSLNWGRSRRPAGNSATAVHRITLPAQIVDQVRRQSRQAGTTPFMWLLAAFKATIFQRTGQHDILTGVPVSGRPRSETNPLIGLFAYPLVIRTRLEGGWTFQQLLANVRETALKAYAHQGISFSKLVEVARPERRGGRLPLFQVMFSMLQLPILRMRLPELMITQVDLPLGTSDFDLFMTLVEDERETYAWVRSDPALFDLSAIEQFAESYLRILVRSVASPESKLLEDRMISEPGPEFTPAPKPGLVIAATFRAEPLERSLRFWAREAAIPERVQFSPYNQVFQELLDPSGLFRQNAAGANLVLIRLEDWDLSPQRSGTESLTRVEENLSQFFSALKAATESSSRPYLVCLCPASPSDLERLGGAERFEEIERHFTEEVNGIHGAYPITASEIRTTYPVSSWYDAYTDQNAQMPYTPAYYTSLSTMIARRLWLLSQPPRKVIVLDCDQTLWAGICGELGPLGIEIDEPRRLLQQFMVEQRARGRLLCLCSKNNEEDVLQVFEQRVEMGLKRQDLVAWRINWQPKSENLKSLAAELSLSLDSFILVDDDPVECAEVRFNCPQVLTLQLPAEAAQIPIFLRRIWAFDHLKTTAEDSRRTSAYQEHRSRAELQKQSLTFEDFIQSLQLQVRIAPPTYSQLERVSELTYRTNQFNLTMKRRAAGQIQQALQSGYRCLAVEAGDRFGEYGLIGAVIFIPTMTSLVVDTFVLSCRALGRGIESKVFHRLNGVARAEGLPFIDISFIETKKNIPALSFLNQQGPVSREPAADGLRFRFAVPVDGTERRNIPESKHG